MHSTFRPGSFAAPQALRAQAARLCAGAGPGVDVRAGYRLLRRAQNLEYLAALAGPWAGCRALELGSFVQGLGRAAAEVCPHRAQMPRLQLPPGPLPVWAPPAPLAAALLNLMANSLLYAGPQPGLRLCCRRAGPWALALVRDAGPGLYGSRGPGRLAGAGGGCRELFGPPGPGDGGLGLPLARHTAQRCGGVLLLESPPRGGFVAALALPLRTGLHPPPGPGPEHWLGDRFGSLFAQLSESCILPD